MSRLTESNAREIAENLIPISCPHAHVVVRRVAVALLREFHRGAADALTREAEWIERRGEQKGSDIASRGVTAIGLRMAAQRHRDQAHDTYASDDPEPTDA